MSESMDLLERINEIDPKSKVLFTSFTYKQDFFEMKIFPHFKEKTYPLILIDHKEYQKNIHEFAKSKNTERKFFIEQIECKSTFHPKILLAISDEKIWLWIGSNNLNFDGFSRNAEIVIPILIERDNSTDTQILPQIKNLLESLKSLVKSSPHRDAIHEMITDLPDVKPAKEQDVNILHNINKKPLFHQILAIIDSPITKMSVISPFFSQEKKFFQKMLKQCGDIHIIVQQNTSNLPVDQIKNLEGLKYSLIDIEDERFLHAKVFFFETKTGNYIFSGSANFTESAILTNNNIEVGVLFKSKISVQSLANKIGVLQKIQLSDIESHSHEIDDETQENSQLRILESVRDGYLLRVKLNDIKGLSKISLLLNGDSVDIPFHIEINQLIFTITEEFLYIFDKTVIVEIEGILKNKLIRSDSHLVYNKTVFPDGLDILNYADINNKNWLFKLLNKLMKLQNFSEYIPVLIKLDERDVFTDRIDPTKFNEFPLVKGGYDPKARLKELIDHFIQKHQNRIKRAIKNHDLSNPTSAINSFILTNKLVIWTVVNKSEPIENLLLVKNNLADFFQEKNSLLSIIPSKTLLELLKESQLKYHTALFVFIIDYLQKRSNKFRPDTRLGYNTVKDVFEISTAKSLNQMLSFEDNVFDKHTFQEIFEQYVEIIPSLSKYSIIDVERDLNHVIVSVDIQIGRKMARVIVR
jgi:HKD family nuclease